MNDKEKQIEEKIKEIAECNKESCQDCKITCTYYYAIKRFCELYLPEDSVVLSREEYIDLSRNYVGEQVAQARKKTAEKFLQLSYDRCLEKSFIKKVEELAKQFGVEIKE